MTAGDVGEGATQLLSIHNFWWWYVFSTFGLEMTYTVSLGENDLHNVSGNCLKLFIESLVHRNVSAMGAPGQLMKREEK